MPAIASLLPGLTPPVQPLVPPSAGEGTLDFADLFGNAAADGGKSLPDALGKVGKQPAREVLPTLPDARGEAEAFAHAEPPMADGDADPLATSPDVPSNPPSVIVPLIFTPILGMTWIVPPAPLRSTPSPASNGVVRISPETSVTLALEPTGSNPLGSPAKAGAQSREGRSAAAEAGSPPSRGHSASATRDRSPERLSSQGRSAAPIQPAVGVRPAADDRLEVWGSTQTQALADRIEAIAPGQPVAATVSPGSAEALRTGAQPLASLADRPTIEPVLPPARYEVQQTGRVTGTAHVPGFAESDSARHSPAEQLTPASDGPALETTTRQTLASVRSVAHPALASPAALLADATLPFALPTTATGPMRAGVAHPELTDGPRPAPSAAEHAPAAPFTRASVTAPAFVSTVRDPAAVEGAATRPASVSVTNTTATPASPVPVAIDLAPAPTAKPTIATPTPAPAGQPITATPKPTHPEAPGTTGRPQPLAPARPAASDTAALLVARPAATSRTSVAAPAVTQSAERIEAPATLIAPTPATPVTTDLAPSPIDTARPAWPTAMVDHIERLRDAADAVSTSIRLLPDALGAIDVSVRKDGEVTHVHLAAEQPQTRALLAEASPKLAEIAEQRGLKLGHTEVGGGGASTSGGQQQAAPQQQARQPAAPLRAPRAETTTPDDSRIA